MKGGILARGTVNPAVLRHDTVPLVKGHVTIIQEIARAQAKKASVAIPGKSARSDRPPLGGPGGMLV